MIQHFLEKQYTELPSDSMKTLREKGWQTFSKLGIPTRKSWPSVLLNEFSEKSFQTPGSGTPSDWKKHLLPACKEGFLLFVNGVYNKELSCPPENFRLSILPLKQAILSYSAYLNNYYAEVFKDEKDPFFALNLALHSSGLLLYLSPNTRVETPLQILHIVDQPHVHSSSKIHLFAGSGSEIELVETFVQTASESLFNPALEVVLDKGAKVKHTHNSVYTTESGYRFSSLRATLKQDSQFESIMATNGGKITRDEMKVHLAGQNAEVNLMGAWSLTNQRQAHAQVLVRHMAPHTRSRQHFKGVLHDSARSSFEGKIFVDKEALKTDAFQLSNNLLLGDKAHADARPNLEIFADDVKASHGATIGQLQEEELFYFKTRGLNEASAKNLLIEGFLKEVTDNMGCPVEF